MHIQGALDVGLRKDSVVETILQCVSYVGFPRAINAITTAREVFSENSALIKTGRMHSRTIQVHRRNC
ncbi:carboxymuconolactone decarboxylase family protein [Bifidobacterium aemilianum]|uniref:carboxymuconolactone decarboxylase family protein n=1 Tax=Bifidobacterium aemilianum TaxID=2493120 RepID=UPI0022A9F9F5|nr:carboxymuconolactone decarboxylase family protein [Bifidobacterium aemilianum]